MIVFYHGTIRFIKTFSIFGHHNKSKNRKHMNQELEMNPNRVTAYLGKPCREFTKADIIRYIKENDILEAYEMQEIER